MKSSLVYLQSKDINIVGPALINLYSVYSNQNFLDVRNLIYSYTLISSVYASTQMVIRLRSHQFVHIIWGVRNALKLSFLQKRKLQMEELNNCYELYNVKDKL